MNYETITECLTETFNKISDLIKEVAEILKELIRELNKPHYFDKYKQVKSLIKPYKQPFIKVRYNARANI